MQHPSDGPIAPRFCPLCGADSESEVIDIAIPFRRAITAPHIAKSIGKAGDATYRQMEEGSREQIRQAAEMTGQPESDFVDMKITDMKDNLREGDITAVAPPPSEVSKLMDQSPGVFGFQAGEAAAGYAAAAHTGANAYAGRKTAMATNQHFATAGRQLVAAGEKGRF